LRKWAENHALLDTGATECFIHPQLVNKLGLKERPLQQPQNVHNVDGTINQAGKTTTGVELTLKLNGKPCDHLFFVTDIGEDDVSWAIPSLNHSILPSIGKKGSYLGKSLPSQREKKPCLPE
jgi:gag-polyprotein putative aspartyl protease